MSNEIKFEPKITTGVPTEEYKANWDRIFKPSLWRKRQEPRLCGACGYDLSKGGMCAACTETIERKAKS